MTTILLFIFTFFFAVLPAAAAAAQAFAPNTLISKKAATAAAAAAVQDDFDRTFREGRDLVDKEEWTKAVEKFKEAINKYPNNKSTDAALYWLAFSYKKQKAFKQTGETLDRLLREFPASSWVTDAKVMKMEVASAALPRRGAIKLEGVSAALPVPGKAMTVLQRDYESILGTAQTASKVQLDRDDEIRLAAFQSLLSADAKRAIETMGGMLRADSKATETLKQETLRALRTPRLLSASRREQFTPLLRETLVKGYQNESSIKIRKDVIYTLAIINDEQSVRYISELYTSEDNKEIKKRIINSFSDSLRILSGPKPDSKTALIRKIEIEKLREILRNETDIELRRLAFSALQRSLSGEGGSSGSRQSNELITTSELIQLYDAEADEELKISFIRFLAGTKQNQASRKLLDIAKNDKSDKLRLEAIYSLRTSKDPEVLKFLEELIK